MAIRTPLVLNNGATQQLQPGDTIPAVPGGAPITDDDYGSSFTIGDRGLLKQPNRLTLTGSERVTLNGTGRLQIFNPLASPPLAFVYEPGSFILNKGQQFRQYKRLTLVGNQRATLLSDARLRVWDEPPTEPKRVTILFGGFSTGSPSLINIPGATFPALAGGFYEVDIVLVVDSSTSAGVQVAVGFSAAGANGIFVVIGDSGSGAATASGPAINVASAVLVNYAGTFYSTIWIKGTVVVGANAGNITAQILKVTAGTASVYRGKMIVTTF